MTRYDFLDVRQVVCEIFDSNLTWRQIWPFIIWPEDIVILDIDITGVWGTILEEEYCEMSLRLRTRTIMWWILSFIAILQITINNLCPKTNLITKRHKL